jgi:excisionase family DNA binding protein
MGQRELDPNRNWNFEEAAYYIGCTTGTLKVWASKRRVPYVKVGRLTRFRKKDLDKWLDSRLVEAQQ